MKDPWAAEVRESPLKKSKNGILPPIRPIEINKNHCFLVKFFNTFQSFNAKSNPVNKKTTVKFFNQVKIYGLITLTPNLLIKMAKPEMIAVEKTRK